MRIDFISPIAFMAILTLMTLTGCAPSEVIPDDPQARACISDAKQLKSVCKSKLLPEYQQCTMNQNMIYQQELAVATSSRSMIQAQLQQCLSECQQQYHTKIESYDQCISPDKYGVCSRVLKRTKTTRVRNDNSYCTRDAPYPSASVSDYSTGACHQLKSEVNNVEMPKKPSASECKYVYNSCDEEYKLNFLRCGGSYD